MRYESLLGVLKTASQWCTLDTSQEGHVFVCGAPRSGTTLLKAVLENHSQLCGPTYESTGVFSNLDFYRDQWWGQTGLSSPEIHEIIEDTKNIIEFYDNLAKRMCEKKKATRFVDKMPWPPGPYRLRYVASKFEGAQWIHIVRDGRDCFCSAQNHPHVPQSKTAASFAKYWRSCVAEHEKRISDKQKFTIRYEDLCRQPSMTVESVMNAVGLDFEKKQVEPGSRRDYDDGAQGAHRRLQEPISDRSVGRWKEELGSEKLTLFQRYAGEALRRFGYGSGS
jgi:hypothetical protein